jgi:23S rRNA (cytosine1962-C5)-methyltransferase
MSSNINTVLSQEINENLVLYPNVISRVFHGRGKYFDQLSHINIEWYPPYLFVQNFSDALDETVTTTLEQVFNDTPRMAAVIIQTRRWPEIESTILCQREDIELPIELAFHTAEELKCHINLGKNRNTGAFLDMRAGWDWVEKNSENKSVLNLFSYTGMFSLFALKGKANKVVNMDMSAGALKTAQRNHNLNGYNKGEAIFLKRDILKSSKQFSRYGPFDLIIADPPPYQKKSFTGWRDYKRLLAWCKDSLNENGTLLLSLNNPHVSQSQFEEELLICFPDAKDMEIIESSSEIKEVDPAKGLKLIAVKI